MPKTLNPWNHGLWMPREALNQRNLDCLGPIVTENYASAVTKESTFLSKSVT